MARIKFHNLKAGEVKLLYAIWLIQSAVNFPRGVRRDEILEQNNWTKNQFYGYYNDLRTVSKSHYILQQKKLYYLAEENLVTKRDTARILMMMRAFARSEVLKCPDGLVPVEDFAKHAAHNLNFAISAVKDKLAQSMTKQYVVQVEREQGVFYIQPLDRMGYEFEWLKSLAEQPDTYRYLINPQKALKTSLSESGQ